MIYGGGRLGTLYDCLVVWGKKAFILGVDEIILPRIASYSEGMETLWITLTAR